MGSHTSLRLGGFTLTRQGGSGDPAGRYSGCQVEPTRQDHVGGSVTRGGHTAPSAWTIVSKPAGARIPRIARSAQLSKL